MASSNATKQTNRLAVTSLLSPPEMKRSDSFSSPMGAATMRTPLSSFTSENTLPPIRAIAGEGHHKEGLPPSPPISPEVAMQDDENMSDCSMGGSNITIRDPQLFTGNENGTALAPSFPLFPLQDRTDTVGADERDLISEHLAKNKSQFQNVCKPPSREDYNLAFEFVSKIGKVYNQDPRAYRQRMIDELRLYPARVQVNKKTPLRKIAPKPTASRKTGSAPVIPRIPRPSRVQKTTPRSRVFDSFDLESSPASISPVPKQPRQPTARDDVDYQSLPDFSPPLSTLPKGNSKVLKAEWKGAMLDLSQDPDRDMLHEAEVNLAATLRLSCATYLCSKRRIFQARIDALRIGKEFRKTDAQQACKIDVNKASKLWTAYEKVGWFNPEFFRQYV